MITSPGFVCKGLDLSCCCPTHNAVVEIDSTAMLALLQDVEALMRW